MSKKDEKLVLGGLLAFGAAVILLQKPNCPNCNTVAEHLINHAIKDFAAALLA